MDDDMDVEYRDGVFGVKDTNLEAMKAKSAAVRLGYFSDPYVKCFVKEEQKRDIILNRGYWSRVTGIQAVQHRFLKKRNDPSDGIKRQIINLGCGYDTFVFNVMSSFEHNCDFNYYELDLEEVVEKKIKFIRDSEKLKCALGGKVEFVRHDYIRSPRYGLTSCDLTNTEDLLAKFTEMGVDFNMPTLIFTECVLAYIDKKAIEALLDFLVQKFNCLALLDYDMVNPNDPFGKMMVYNFAQRGIPLVGINFFESLESIKGHYLKRHMTCEIANMRTIYYNYLDQHEKQRIEKLEFLDELEEWWLVQEHYFISLSKKTRPANVTGVSGFDILDKLGLSEATG